jgi:hypothetical protein
VAGGKGSLELSLAAACRCRGGNREGDVAQLGNCSPELGRRRGGGAPVAMPRLQMPMAWAR